MILLALLAAAQAPDAPRPTGAVRTSQQSVEALQACFARAWVNKGRITALPVPNGIDLLFQISGPLMANPGKETMVFEIRDKGSERLMTAYYRRPWSAKTTIKLFNETVDRCEAPA